MKLFKSVSVLLVTVGLFFNTSAAAMAPDGVKQPLGALSVQELIYRVSRPEDARIIASIAKCESTNQNYEVWGDGHAAYGILQFHESTFDRYAKLMGEDLNWKSQVDQVRLISWIAEHKPESLSEWTTFRAIKNGGVYNFTSHGKKYSVHCSLLDD